MPDPTAPERPRRPDCSMVWDFTKNRCTERAVRWMQVGCVHEHIEVGAACAEHKQMLLAGDPLISCTPCREGGDPHRCKLVARVISNEERDRMVRVRRAAEEARRA